MALPGRAKQVVSDPLGTTSRFVVGGGPELRLIEWQKTQQGSRFNTVATCSELGQVRCLAWSPHPTTRDLIAAGLHAGRVVLVRLEASISADRPAQAPPAAQINIRHARPCNVVTFCSEQPGLLAVGLEKGRGESLLVYDVQHASRSIQGSKLETGLEDPRETTLHTTPASTNEPPAPLLSFGSSESVSSAAFLAPGTAAASSPLLVAGMAGKWLRVYDLRASSPLVATWGSRSGHCISANPFNGQQFVSSADDGIVRLWDLRKPMDALLSFSEADAAAVSMRARPAAVARALTEIAWNKTRSGVLTTLERDSHFLRMWTVVDGPFSKPLETGQPVDEDKVDAIKPPVVLEDRQPPAFQNGLSSFAFLESPSRPGSINLIGVSRDSSAPGNSGHRLEIVQAPAAQHAAFGHRGIIVTDSSEPNGMRALNPSTQSRRPSTAAPVEAELSAAHARAQAFDGRERVLKLDISGSRVRDRDQTPRPSALQDRPHPPVVSQDVLDSNQRSGIDVLSTDESILIKQRIEMGYGLDASNNVRLLEDPSLSEFWSWIARAETFAVDAFIGDHDFRFRGVMSILHGFSSNATTSSAGPPGHRLTGRSSPSQVSPRSIYSDVTRSLRKGDEVQSKNAAYASAVAQLVQRRKLDGTIAMSSSSFINQRKIAMQCCGPDWEETQDVVCARYVKDEDFEAAARHSFFSGHLEKSMSYLKNCKDDSVRMLAPILAAYLAQKESKSDPQFTELCRSLSSDVGIPWVRAMLAFLASGDWRELVDEGGLPLRDRVAVALRFLSDSELMPFLNELGNEALSTGDPEAVVLFGLRDDGVRLLSNLLDRTADVQTIALAASFVCPGIVREDRRLIRWIEAYRSLLDTLQLYHPRAIFDISRSRRARTLADQARSSGRHADAKEVQKALRKAAPPQMVVRCQFCATNISPSAQSLAVVEGDRTAAGTTSSACPSCSKSLPSCCVCLQKPAIPALNAGIASSLCWCQRCRHGGHASHILEWFERSDVCPVADCDCQSIRKIVVP